MMLEKVVVLPSVVMLSTMNGIHHVLDMNLLLMNPLLLLSPITPAPITPNIINDQLRIRL